MERCVDSCQSAVARRQLRESRGRRAQRAQGRALAPVVRPYRVTDGSRLLSSNLPESHAPLDWRAIRRLGNPVKLQHVRPSRYPKMLRDFPGDRYNAHALNGAPKRKPMTLGKVDDVRNV